MKDRTAKILRIFITSDYPVTLEQLEEEFHTSSRTIRNELREINLLLRTNQLPEVKNLRKKGYHLLLDKDQKQRLLIRWIRQRKNTTWTVKAGFLI